MNETNKECNCERGINPRGQCCIHCYAGDSTIELCKNEECNCNQTNKEEQYRGVLVGNKPIWLHNVKIIGNIYENSGLLKVENKEE